MGFQLLAAFGVTQYLPFWMFWVFLFVAVVLALIVLKLALKIVVWFLVFLFGGSNPVEEAWDFWFKRPPQ